MAFATFVINLLAACVFLILVGWTVDLLAALRRPSTSATPAPSADLRADGPGRHGVGRSSRNRGPFPVSP
jgi:hypothetical protein